MKVKFEIAGLLFIAVFPLMGWSQSTLNFPLPVDAASGSQVGYAVVNPTRSAASVTFKVYDETGVETGSKSLTIPAGGQTARLFGELFTNSTASGWVQATSTVAGLKGFTMGGDFVNNVDGVGSADASTDQIFPFMAATTALVFANPAPAPVNLNVRIFTPSGSEITPAIDLSVPGHGWLARPMLDLPSFGQQYADARYVRVTGAGAFAATAMVAQYLVAKPEFALYNGIDLNKAESVLNFPHVVSGELNDITYRTGIAIVNLSDTQQFVTLTFTPDSGLAPISVQLLLNGGGAIRDVLTFPGGGFKNGWLQVRSAGPISGMMVVTNAGRSSVGISVVQPQQGGANAMLFPHIANAAPWSTGLALVNTTSSPATVEVFAVNADGTLIGGAANAPTAQFTLNPGAKTSRLVTELVPQTRLSNGGFIFVRTNGAPVIGEELFTLRSGGPIANVPLEALPSTINFTPPAQ